MATDGTGAVTATMSVPNINTELCSGCGRCVAACPEKAFTLESVQFHKNAVIRYPERCNACGRCFPACPVAALHW
jgi:formate hydrogenlyase subunit 6/NADH:ubiquinone oxidoreductase subunit I